MSLKELCTLHLGSKFTAYWHFTILSVCLSVHLSCLSDYLSLIYVFIIFIFSVPNGEADNIHWSFPWSTNYFVSPLLRK